MSIYMRVSNITKCYNYDIEITKDENNIKYTNTKAVRTFIKDLKKMGYIEKGDKYKYYAGFKPIDNNEMLKYSVIFG